MQYATCCYDLSKYNLYGFSNRKVQSKELFFLHGIV